MIRLLYIFLVPATLCAFTKIDNVYTTDGSFADAKAAVVDAVAGDTVIIPAGTYSDWGSGGAIVVDKAITIAGAGRALTILTGSTGSPTVFNVSAAATISGFTFNGNDSGTIIFSVNGAEGSNIGARFTDLKLDFTGGLGNRMFMINRVYALADNCEFVGGGGNNEYIFMRGPNDAWDHPANPGGAEAFYFEDCTYAGSGYPDINAAGRAVFRFCTVTTNTKFDGHGFASNSLPTRGVRLFEVYLCNWTIDPGSSATSLEPRGGTVYIWGNRAHHKSSYWPNFYLREYGVESRWNNFDHIWQTPSNYPIPDQIGAGPGTVVVNGSGTQAGGAEPAYLWDNAQASLSTPVDWAINWKNGSSVNFTTDGSSHSIGATTINLTAGVSNVAAGNWIAIDGDNNRYEIAVDHTSSSTTIVIESPGLLAAIPASATTVTAGPNTNYQGQQGDHTATFTTEDDIIVADRDYFWGDYGWPVWDGSSGIGSGTRAEMDAITPTTDNVGFWVTDEGEWNSNSAGADGRLYTWNGTSWELNYTPYPYPHPLRLSSPVSVGSINASSLTTPTIVVDG